MKTEVVKVKCLQCKKTLNAVVKVTPKTRNIAKYIEISGGARRISDLGYPATYCFSCIKKLSHTVTVKDSPVKYYVGDIVRHIHKPEWDVGRILATYDDAVRTYFINVGEKLVKLKLGDKSLDNIIKVDENEKNQPIFKLFDIKYEREGHHNVYVVRLRDDVLKVPSFVAANPQHDGKKPCLYVGMTGLSPEERFQNHKDGYKSSYYPHKYGEELLPAFYKCLNPMQYEAAREMEYVLANLLRKQGFAVWQN